MTSLFDPLAAIRALGGHLELLPDGRIDIRYDGFDMGRRRRCSRLLVAYYSLLRLQLDVPAGERPRTVQQLVASGRLTVQAGRYVVRP